MKHLSKIKNFFSPAYKTENEVKEENLKPDQDHYHQMIKTQNILSASTEIGFSPKRSFENYGYCYCCNSLVKFVANGEWWRDQYICSNCGSIPRERALMASVDHFFPNWRDLEIHESSPTSRGASLRFLNECPGYSTSNYFPEIKPGTTYMGNRCENLEELTFGNNCIDLFITQEVFEHVFQPEKAFNEIARVLKPGGAHVFTTPLVNKYSPSSRTAEKNDDGTIEHFLDNPEYHSNPVSSEGSLVTMHWGYDICEFIFKCSGLFTQIIYIDNLDLGIRAEFIEVLITYKSQNGL